MEAAPTDSPVAREDDSSLRDAATVPARIPPKSPLFGHVLTVRRDPLGTLLAWHRTYGDVIRVKLRRWTLFLNDPADVRHVLVSHASRYHKGEAFRVARRVFGNGLLASEEPLHLQQRRLVQPAFHREALRSYAETMVVRARATSERWPSLGAFDLSAEMTQLTLGIAARTMFGVHDVGATSELSRAVDVSQEFLYRKQTSLWPVPEWVPTPTHLRYRRAVALMDRLVYGILDAREASGEARRDLLGLLLQARDESGHGMDRRQLRDEALTLLLAGHETTANALAWTLYLLATHPEVEQRAVAEVAAVTDGGAATPSDLGSFEQLDRILAEALRLYPPAWILPRVAIEADVLPSGTAVPVDQAVVVSPWTMHRSPRFYAEPDRFDPERFASPRREPLPDFALFPFGGGSRRCIGEPFARMELALVVATILPRIRIRVLPGQRIEPAPRVTLRPRYGIRVVAEDRRAAAS